MVGFNQSLHDTGHNRHVTHDGFSVATGGAGAERERASFDKVKVTSARRSVVLPLYDHVKYIRMKLPSQLDIIIIMDSSSWHFSPVFMES